MIRGIVKIERCEDENIKNKVLTALYRLIEHTDGERGVHLISYTLGETVKLKILAKVD
jgi:hypothetical protein